LKLKCLNPIAALFGGLALVASAHANLPAPQTVAPPAEGVVLGAAASVKGEVKADAYTPSTVQQQRNERLKGEIARKLSRKPKHERDAVVGVWQTARGTVQDQPAFDQPQSAQTFFLEKRLAAGQRELSPSMYEGALRQSAQMPVYSTPERRMVSPAGSAARAGDGPAAIATRSAAGPSGANPATAADGTSPVAASVGVTGALSGPWEALGPGNIGGRTRALVIHPTTPNTMWAGAVAGGIWKTTDGGTTWTPKADLLINIAVSSLVLDPRNPNTLYAGTGEGFFNGDAVRGAGILKSTDGGETWAQMPSTANSPDFHYVQKIVVTRGASQRIYAATRTGVFRSTDGGATWGRVINAVAVNGCMDMAVQSDRALAYVFASCGTFAQGTIYRALDSGAATQNWVPVLSTAGMGRTSLALAPSNQNIVYAMSASTATGAFNNGLLAVYRSNTSGATGSWTTQVDNTSPVTLNRLLLSNPVIASLTACNFGTSAFLNQGWYDNFIAVDPADPETVWAGGIDTFRSNDGGRNWGQASHWWFGRGIDTDYAHADHHGVVFHPQYNGTSNKTMFNISDGGIFVTADARAPVSASPDPINPNSPVCGNTPTSGNLVWGEKNNGYAVTQFYHGAHYPSGNTFIGGTQDNGTLRGVTGAPNAWQTIRGGDGGYVAVVPNNTNILFAENTGLSIQRSVNAGAAFSPFSGGITEGGGNFLFITPFAQDGTDPNVMWIGGAAPWRASQAAVVPGPATPWVEAGQFFRARISAWAVSKLNNNRVYAGTGSGGGVANNCRVFTTGVGLTATASTVWSSSKVRADACFISWIEPDPVVAGTVYATVSTFNSGADVGHVFKSTNFGASWVSIDGSGATGIPDVPVHAIAIDPNNNQRLYLGTDIGVFVSLDGGANWARENTGFANVIVESLSIKNTAPRYLFAYTHGRSVYRVALP
jgi:photosystem II stability/assembly factor-like uncharacterized protein